VWKAAGARRRDGWLRQQAINVANAKIIRGNFGVRAKALAA